jgi:hypothetical protein
MRHERAISPQLGGRTVFDGKKQERPALLEQLSLF